jgi:hypothetical protein
LNDILFAYTRHDFHGPRILFADGRDHLRLGGGFAMHIEDLTALIQDDVFLPVRIDAGGGIDILLKIEGLNPAGSIKFKTAVAMIADMERSGRLKPGATVVESSSGNLGLALSIVCRALGYGFVCVSDPNISPATRDMIEATGGRMEPVTETDENGAVISARGSGGSPPCSTAMPAGCGPIKTAIRPRNGPITAGPALPCAGGSIGRISCSSVSEPPVRPWAVRNISASTPPRPG